jgi:c-di-AMP phosphodiesterase-like protein
VVELKKLLAGIFSLTLTIIFVYLYYSKHLEAFMYISIIGLVFATIMFTMFGFRNSTNKIKMLEDRLEVWNNISYHVKQAGDEAFNELPVGIIIYDDEFQVKWGNDFAKSIFKANFIESRLNEVNEAFFEHIKNGDEKFKLFH